jgi:protein phosphatase inhibitor 2
MNIIATYHPVDKDYGHMKIEEPKTPYAPNDIIDEEIDTEVTTTGINPDTLAQRFVFISNEIFF